MGVLSAAAAMWGAPAAAQSYPQRPIKLVVGFPPGGPTDAVARIIGERAAQTLGQSVIIENRPGASANIGAAYVARSAPDGYTLLFSTAGVLSMNPFLYKNPGYEVKDFAPITEAVRVPAIIAVTPSFPANDLKTFVQMAQKDPGKISFASAGFGGPPHMAAELLMSVAKIKMLHVPYKGAAPAIADIMGGQVEMGMFDLPVLLPQVKAGKVKALAITSTARSPLLPDVPTIVEAGYPDAVYSNWYGLVAPAATPAPILDQITKAFVGAMHDPAVHEKLVQMGAIVVASSPAEFDTRIKEEAKMWGDIIKKAGIKPE
ncbi:tripartite tricarboxylate transporter substrate binding protein [Pigmentiphaga soli]|uniref:Tripartite tricarboxylate transporter substrate binding protein n=2 Tax=Pigmentiphaga soli TaxID=1007095 RepID=A0ABP8GF59_9BURK